jgi:uncharacterized membrane protein YkvA (DUF1232 family)
MGLSISIELSDNDLDHFQEVLKRAQETAGRCDAQQIIQSAHNLLAEASKVKAPDFIAQRLSKLESLIGMIQDEGWALPEADKRRVLTALSYFADPKDVIPDSIPVVGYLDDAIMIELCVRELKHEVEAYEDFSLFRKNESVKRGVEPHALDREDWLERHREELQERMERRRERDRYTGPGQGAGFFRFR